MGRIYGSTQLILEAGGELSEDRYGLSTGRLVFRCPPGRWDMMPRLGSGHPYASFVALERRQIRFTRGLWTIVCDYAGSEQEDSEPEYELELGTGREPIETHPDFIEKIGGTAAAPKNGAVFLDDTGHPTSDAALGVFDRFRMSVGGGRNPMAGVTQYEAYNTTMWAKVWTSRRRPSQGSGFGKIDNPEGPAPNLGNGRNWRFAGLSSRKRGSAYSNRKVWQASGPGGWNPLIYGN